MRNDKNKNELMSFSSEDLAEAIKNSVMDTLSDFSKFLKDLGERMDKVENSTTIDHNAQNNISKHASARIHTLLGKSTSEDYVKYGRTFRGRLWVGFRDRFGVSSYRDTRLVDYDAAVVYCDEWFPDNGVEALKHDIDVIKAIQMKDKIETINRIAEDEKGGDDK